MAPNSKGKTQKPGTKGSATTKSNASNNKTAKKKVESSYSESYSSQYGPSDHGNSDYYDYYSESNASSAKNTKSKPKTNSASSSESYYGTYSDLSSTYDYSDDDNTSKKQTSKSNSKKNNSKQTDTDKIAEIYKKFKIKRSIGKNETVNEEVSYKEEKDKKGKKKLVKNVTIYINIPKEPPHGSKSSMEIGNNISSGTLSSPMNGYKTGSPVEIRQTVTLRYLGIKNSSDYYSSSTINKKRAKSIEVYNKNNDSKVPTKKATKGKNQSSKRSSKNRSKSVEPKSNRRDENSSLYADYFGNSDSFFDTDTATMIDENEIDYSRIKSSKASSSQNKGSSKSGKVRKSFIESSTDYPSSYSKNNSGKYKKDASSSDLFYNDISDSDIPSSTIAIPKSPYSFRSSDMQYESPHPSKSRISDQEILNRFIQGGRVNENGQIVIKVNKVDEKGNKTTTEEVLPKTMITGHDYVASNSYIYHDSEGRPYLRVIKQKFENNSIENYESRLYISDPEAQIPFDEKIPNSKISKNGVIVNTLKTKQSKRTGEVIEYKTEVEIEKPILRCKDFVFISPMIEYDVRTKRKYVNVIRQRKNPVTRKVENIECREDIPNIPTMIESNLNIQNEHVWIVGGHIFRIIVKYIPFNGVIINTECLQEVSSKKSSSNGVSSGGSKKLKVIRTKFNQKTGTTEQIIDEVEVTDETVGNQLFIAPDPTVYRRQNGKAYFKCYKRRMDSYSQMVGNYECEEEIPESELVGCPSFQDLPKNSQGIPYVFITNSNKKEEKLSLSYESIPGIDFLVPNQCVYRDRNGKTFIEVIRTKRNVKEKKFENYQRTEKVRDTGKGDFGRKVIRQRKNVIGSTEEYLEDDDNQLSNKPKLFTRCLRKRWNPFQGKYEMYECPFEVNSTISDKKGRYILYIIRSDKNGHEFFETFKELTTENSSQFKNLELKFIRKQITVIRVRKSNNGFVECYNEREDVYLPQFTTDKIEERLIPKEIFVTKLGVNDKTGKIEEFSDRMIIYEPYNVNPIIQKPYNGFLTPKDSNRLFNLSPQDIPLKMNNLKVCDDFFMSDVPIRPLSPGRYITKDVPDTDIYMKERRKTSAERKQRRESSSSRKPSVERKQRRNSFEMESSSSRRPSQERKSRRLSTENDSSSSNLVRKHSSKKKNEMKSSSSRKPSVERKQRRDSFEMESSSSNLIRKPSQERKSRRLSTEKDERKSRRLSTENDFSSSSRRPSAERKHRRQSEENDLSSSDVRKPSAEKKTSKKSSRKPSVEQKSSHHHHHKDSEEHHHKSEKSERKQSVEKKREKSVETKSKSDRKPSVEKRKPSVEKSDKKSSEAKSRKPSSETKKSVAKKSSAKKSASKPKSTNPSVEKPSKPKTTKKSSKKSTGKKVANSAPPSVAEPPKGKSKKSKKTS
ncbi:RING finger domain-containing, polycomb group component family, partial [Trichomonas vaginalis G3]